MDKFDNSSVEQPEDESAQSLDAMNIHYSSEDASAESTDSADSSVLLDSEIPENGVLVSNTPRVSRMRLPLVKLPWWLIILIGTALVSVFEIVIFNLGQNGFWSLRLIYTISLIWLLIVAVIFTVYIVRFCGLTHKHAYIINGLIAVFSGLIAAIAQFVNQIAFWTFFNLIAQPINALILGVLGVWIALKIFPGNKIN